MTGVSSARLVVGGAVILALAVGTAVSPAAQSEASPRNQGGGPSTARSTKVDVEAQEREAIKYLERLGASCSDTEKQHILPVFYWLTPCDIGETLCPGLPLPNLTLGGYDIAFDPGELANKCDFARLLQIRKIPVLVLNESDVGDREIAVLARHPCIRALCLAHTRATDAALLDLSRTVLDVGS